jgi:DnaK suppressor protein
VAAGQGRPLAPVRHLTPLLPAFTIEDLCLETLPTDRGAVGVGRNGAKHMKKADMKVYKQRLLLLRARLRGDVNAMADAALNKTRTEASGDLSSMPIHMADLGSDNYEQEFTLSLLQNEEDTLELIESALERIEEGQYGSCVECDGTIPKTRLNAIPYTPFCVKCAAKIQES